MTDIANSNSAYTHAVIAVDAHKAQVTRFNADTHENQFLKAQSHNTPQHNSDVRDSHEFFGSVCNAVAGLDQILVTGGHVGLAGFKHYVTKHRPALMTHIISYEAVDHPSESQLVAYARTFFHDHERLAH